MRAVVTVGLACAIGLFFSCAREAGEDDGKSGHPDPGTAADAGADAAREEGIDGCPGPGHVICPRGAGTEDGTCPAGDGCNQCICPADLDASSHACTTRPCDSDALYSMICTPWLPDAGASCDRDGLRCWYLADAGGCFHTQCSDGGWEVGPIESCF